MNPNEPPQLPPRLPPLLRRTSQPPVAVDLRNVRGAEGLSVSELHERVLQGGRLVVFHYCISVVVLSFKRSSPIYFIQPGESAFSKGVQYSALSMLAGWWGIPWGPIWTLITLATNIGGGQDVTRQALASLGRPLAPPTGLRSGLSPVESAERAHRRSLAVHAAWAVLVLVFLGIIWVGYKVWTVDVPQESLPGEAGFRAANQAIGASGTAAAGNSPEAVALAGRMSQQMSLLRELKFEQSTDPSWMDAHDAFKTYCELGTRRCVFLVHVPELRRFDADAQERMGQLAWLAAQALIADQELGTTNMEVAVGLRGIVSYDRVLVGFFTPDANANHTGVTRVWDEVGCERTLFLWFAATGSE